MSGDRKWAVASNCEDVWKAAIGEEVRGFFHDRGAGGDMGTTVLVFKSGWGLAFGTNGSFWTVSPDNIAKHLRLVHDQAVAARQLADEILQLAGGLPEQQKVTP